MEAEQTIEAFLYKKAKTHNHENFNYLKSLMGADKVESLEKFQKHTFTFDDPEYIAGLAAGMKPIQIQNLKPQNSIFRYFT